MSGPDPQTGLVMCRCGLARLAFYKLGHVLFLCESCDMGKTKDQGPPLLVRYIEERT